MAFYTNFATEFFHTVFTRRSVLKGTVRRDQKVIFVKSPISSPIVNDQSHFFQKPKLLLLLMQDQRRANFLHRGVFSPLDWGCVYTYTDSKVSGYPGRRYPGKCEAFTRIQISGAVVRHACAMRYQHDLRPSFEGHSCLAARYLSRFFVIHESWKTVSSLFLSMSHVQVNTKQRNFVGLQTSDFRDIYLNRIAEKVNQYLSGCVPVDEKYGT